MLQPLPDQPEQREATDLPSVPAPTSSSSVWLPADWVDPLIEAESSTPTAEVIDIHPGARWLPPEVPLPWTPPAAPVAPEVAEPAATVKP